MFSFAKFGLLCTLAFSAATAVTAAPIAQEQGHDTPMRRGNSGKATYYSGTLHLPFLQGLFTWGNRGDMTLCFHQY